jgi:hypothetical protein
MHATHHRSNPVISFGSVCLTGVLLGVSALGAMAEATKTPAEIQSRYEQDRAKCLSGNTNQDQATCLREAGAARDAAKQGQLNDAGAQYRKNQQARCDVLTGDEQRDCLARMKGAGKVSGSAQGGGIYRELTTRETKPVDSAASAVPAP